MFKGKALAEATHEFREKHPIHADQTRRFCGVETSSVALGTYLGPMNEVADHQVIQAALKAFDLGVNFVDTAINYRAQRAERSIGEALRRGVLSGKIRREELFISTKGGFVPFESAPVADLPKLFEEEYVAKGIAKRSDLVARCHCLEPAFLENQLERSRVNLQVETIDLYYLHNPEMQLEELPERLFYEKLEAAFGLMERAVRDGRIGAYGMATWAAFREEQAATGAVSLERCVQAAESAARKERASRHSFKAVQLPLNLAMPEAALFKTQRLGGEAYSAIEAAKRLGLDVAVSAPLFQGRLCHGLPDFILEKFPPEYSQAHSALAFATGFEAVDCAMVGMKHPDHVGHDLEFLRKPKLSKEQLRTVSGAIVR